MEKINNKIEEVGIKGTVLYISKDTRLYYSRGRLFYESSESIKQSVALPLGRVKQLAAQFRISERALRLFPRCAIKLSDTSFLISYSGSVYQYLVKDNELIQEHQYCTGMSNPLSFCRIESVKGFPDCIVYGEYRDNENHTPLGIYERIGGKWAKTADFPFDIKHIHALVPDSANECVYVLTGDDDRESGIWVARDNFQKVEPWLTGKQKYRGCVAFPTENGLIYATDTPKEKNELYLAKKNSELIPLCEMPGPCIYGTQKNGVFYFATSVEPDPNLPSWRYKISSRPGPGIKDGFVHIIAGNLEEGFKDVARFKKDAWPYRMFQFGNVLFQQCDVDDKILIQPISVKKYDNCALFL